MGITINSYFNYNSFFSLQGIILILPIIICRVKIRLKVKMPRYVEEEDMKKPRRACDGLREDLKDCLLNSDCVRKVFL